MEKHWTLELERKPDFDRAMERIYAWFEQELIDRPPIRFAAHNAGFSAPPRLTKIWPSLKDRWFDAEYQVDLYTESIRGRKFYAETFPVFSSNLGPEVYAAFFGSELEYKEVTSYSIPLVKEWADMEKVRFDRNNPYFKKIDEINEIAFEKCPGKFMVAYTVLCPIIDCVAAWRDPQQLCMDMLLSPDNVKQLIKIASDPFNEIFDYYDDILKKHHQLSVSWMDIPSFGKMHIPACDFASMISPDQFDEFVLPTLQQEVKHMTHNVFHLDGKGVANHVDKILAISEINAIQWVQGVGDDQPIMQWVPFIKKIQAAGKSLVLDIQVHELEDFIGAMDPRGLMLCIPAEESIQPSIIRRIERW
ncbi:MAG: hypothetical protein V2A67_01710 [Bacteroidota bacterium]